MTKKQRALWVSTSMSTRGGVASFVRDMRSTPLWDEWHIDHVPTHRDGSIATKLAAYQVAVFVYAYRLLVHRPTVVHLHMSSYGSFPRKYLFELLARVLRIPVVLHVHGSDFSVFYEGANRALRAAIRDSIGGAAVVIALGEPWADALRAIAPTARITVVSNAIRPAAPVDQRPGHPVRVLFLGEVGERKGTFTLLEAWHRMLDARGDAPPPRLTVAGAGAVERARKMTADLGIASTVEITGWLEPQRVPELLDVSQVLVLPSHREGQPMAILEAMARGLCVVTCPVGGIPDMIDERCGLVVPPGAAEDLAVALGRAIDDDALRERLGAAALQRVREEFDIDVVWRRFDRIYREIGS
ncbi:glycosyltransferase family 4 protein [Nocardia sp. CDC153]|uniref:glycosyltransferase family 4 protein n=1 Tax=Nocardia sp. CDC153 TaxID=3112167 RepID=UPI002DB8F94D|nr:glycosyltransferase family 4 protein [Nocardia sp. CDC153]MEC3955846.1 glycosyltransferase family 4 protein [Nocardia sp. CDC153]